MIDDFSKSIRAYLYDRTTSPLFGAFVVSWVVWNYRLVAILFSNYDADFKFEYIDTFLYPTLSACLERGVLFPLLTAIGFIFIYPIPARYIYRYWRYQQRLIKQIRQRIDEEELLSKEESKQLKHKIYALEAQYDELVTRKDNEIAYLKSRVNELEEQNSDVLKTLTEKNKEIDGYKAGLSKHEKQVDDYNEATEYTGDENEYDLNLEEVEVLSALGKSSKSKMSTLKQATGSAEVRIEYIITKLKDMGLVGEEKLSGVGTVYFLSSKGKSFVIENNIV